MLQLILMRRHNVRLLTTAYFFLPVPAEDTQWLSLYNSQPQVCLWDKDTIWSKPGYSMLGMHKLHMMQRGERTRRHLSHPRDCGDPKPPKCSQLKLALHALLEELPANEESPDF
jgi:hypothetical protein